MQRSRYIIVAESRVQFSKIPRRLILLLNTMANDDAEYSLRPIKSVTFDQVKVELYQI
jgi:hypothetical protein